jgi:hypothetical protein
MQSERVLFEDEDTSLRYTEHPHYDGHARRTVGMRRPDGGWETWSEDDSEYDSDWDFEEDVNKESGAQTEPRVITGAEAWNSTMPPPPPGKTPPAPPAPPPGRPPPPRVFTPAHQSGGPGPPLAVQRQLSDTPIKIVEEPWEPNPYIARYFLNMRQIWQPLHELRALMPRHGRNLLESSESSDEEEWVYRRKDKKGKKGKVDERARQAYLTNNPGPRYVHYQGKQVPVV